MKRGIIRLARWKLSNDKSQEPLPERFKLNGVFKISSVLLFFRSKNYSTFGVYFPFR